MIKSALTLNTYENAFFGTVGRRPWFVASGLTPWLALELPDDLSQITNEQLQEWKKKQALARIAAQSCNVLYEELGLRRRMNFYFKFKTSCEWKNLGYL
jgi:hypothetical protein